MPNSRYPAVDPEHITRVSEGISWKLKDGSPLTEVLAVTATPCMDGRHDKRKISAQAADYILERDIHPDTISEMRTACAIYSDHGLREEINLKAYNMLRDRWVKAYNHGPAGGRYSADFLAGFLTMRKHGVRLTHLCLTQHDGCAAAAAGTRISWKDSIRYTLHDLWAARVDNPVEILTADVVTYGSLVRNIVSSVLYVPEEYHQLVQNRGSLMAIIPLDNGDYLPTEIPVLHSDQDAAYEMRRQLLQAVA